jgi:predicted dithiol-disulfide oxidoreductase (DUF899 family)
MTTEKKQAASLHERPLHERRFPGESAAYRAARDRLLEAEIALRRNIEEVAAMRRALPVGGEIAQDYAFEEGAADLADTQQIRQVRLSELFARPEASLVVYSFMYGPNMAKACPMCTAMLDSLDRAAPHARERLNLVVVAKSPIARIRAHARDRGWRSLRLLSSANNSYNRDYFGEDEKGAQQPALNVFTMSGGRVRHAYCTELLFAPSDPGQDARHVDIIWPLWNLFDFTRGGRGADWYPQLDYRS